jgi:putative transposase
MARHIDIRKKSVQSGDALCPIALVPQANRRSTYPQPAATARLETPPANICTILPYPREGSQLEVSVCRSTAGMKRARFNEEQIISILKEAEAGAKVTELCRRHGISVATFYPWHNSYGGLEISEVRRVRQLEEENRRLKSIVADQALDIRALKDVLAKNGYGP